MPLQGDEAAVVDANASWSVYGWSLLVRSLTKKVLTSDARLHRKL